VFWATFGAAGVGRRDAPSRRSALSGDSSPPWRRERGSGNMAVDRRRTAGGNRMHAVIGRVKIKPGHEDETRAMIASHGIAMVQGMIGSSGGYWSRSTDEGDVIQHSFWLFDSDANARAAEAVFNTLRNMPEAPATFVSVDVCEDIGQA
jgi:hypothetical protein